MTQSLHDSFVFEAFVGDAFVQREAPTAHEIVVTLKRADAWHEASIHPKDGAQFPRLLISFHGNRGFVVQCFEDEQAWSDFLVLSNGFSLPQVEMELGGQALERWPRELFVPEGTVVEALEAFLNSGKQKPELQWVRIDRFPREVVWDSRESRKAWERSRQAQVLRKQDDG